MRVSLLFKPITKLVLGACFSVTSFLGTIGNFISLYCLWKTRKHEAKTKNSVLLLLSLNLSDLVNCMVVAPFQAVYTTKSFPRTNPIHLAQIYLAGKKVI